MPWKRLDEIAALVFVLLQLPPISNAYQQARTSSGLAFAAIAFVLILRKP